MLCRDEDCQTVPLHAPGPQCMHAPPPALTEAPLAYTLNDVRHSAFLHAKQAASRLGIPLLTYLERQALGQKWCTYHKAWHNRSAFGTDKSRTDGLNPRCRRTK